MIDRAFSSIDLSRACSDETDMIYGKTVAEYFMRYLVLNRETKLFLSKSTVPDTLWTRTGTSGCLSAKRSPVLIRAIGLIRRFAVFLRVAAGGGGGALQYTARAKFRFTKTADYILFQCAHCFQYLCNAKSWSPYI